MQFKNSEILYFLFLLIIPILVHLFQLKKFKKVAFTNVAFLQKIVFQTRKSSQLKKWLILATRMLLFCAIIFAFSQPYFGNKNKLKKQQNLIYLDNSLSMDSKGKKGNLLQIASQEIIENSNENNLYSLLTNDQFFKDISASELKKILLNIENSGKSPHLNEIFLKLEDKIRGTTKTSHNTLLISDFQLNNKNNTNQFTNVTNPYAFVKLAAETQNNLSIDSVFIIDQNSTNFNLNVVIKNQGNEKENIPISLFNNQKLVSKLSFSIDANSEKNIDFNVEKNNAFLGRLELNSDDSFSFDNSFYFSLNFTQKIKVLTIGKASKFLPKIYTENEFIYSENSEKNIDYNAIPKQQLVVLNELVDIPQTLSKTILDFTNNGGHLVIIPNESSSIDSYNRFLNSISAGKMNQKRNDSLKVTEINYNHPLFKDVFINKVLNFQYPYTKASFSNSIQGSIILYFENQEAFLKEITTNKSKIYWFSSSLEMENSNFRNSPLIVPVFYNIGLHSLRNTKLAYSTNDKSTIDVAVSLSKDEILSINISETSIIPLQQSSQNKVTITMEDQIHKAGFFHILNKKDTLKTVAFNYPKEESLLSFRNIEKLAEENENFHFSGSIANFFKENNNKNKVHSLWKWFLSIAIVSLLLEILILKFFKS